MKNTHIFCSLSMMLIAAPIWAQNVSVAVAANFVAPMQEIATQFKQKTGHHLTVSPGATGKFYAQIKNGAPFEVLLSADNETPERLEREGDAVAGTRVTYAIGRLVLWSPKTNYVDAKGEVLKSEAFAHLAIANPKVAPYGQAAQQVMERMGVWNGLQSKIVRGENIAQTMQFVESGNAELGFVAYSQVLNNSKITGTYWLIPNHMHQPIVQQAVLLNKGKNNTAAQAFLRFLQSKTVVAIIQKYGYDIR